MSPTHVAPIPTSALTTLDTGNNCKRGSIKSRESKEVQKPGLFAERENVRMRSLRLRPKLHPPHSYPASAQAMRKNSQYLRARLRQIMVCTSEVVKEPEALRKQAGLFLEEKLQKDK